MASLRDFETRILAAKRIAGSIKGSLGINDLRNLAFDVSRTYEERILYDVVELLHHSYLLRTGYAELRQSSGWSDEGFLLEVSQDYEKFCEASLFPCESALVRFHLQAFIEASHDDLIEFEKLVGTSGDIESTVDSQNEIRRAEIFVLIGRLVSLNSEFDELQRDFPHALSETSVEAFNPLPWVKAYIHERDRLFSISKTLEADDGEHFFEAPIRAFYLESLSHAGQLIESAEARYPKRKWGRAYSNLTFAHWPETFVVKSQPPDSDSVRCFLADAVSYYRESVPDIVSARGEDDDDLEAAVEKTRETTDRILADESLWSFLEQTGYSGSKFLEWIDNLKALQPLVVAQGKLNLEKRELVQEIFDGFVIGNYFSVFALMRAICERVLRDRAKSLGVSISWPTTHAVGGREKSLEELIDDVCDVEPNFQRYRNWLHEVRNRGNAVLHKKSHRTGQSATDKSRIRRDRQLEALEAIRMLSGFLELA
jgi:hypothetical protein